MSTSLSRAALEALPRDKLVDLVLLQQQASSAATDVGTAAGRSSSSPPRKKQKQQKQRPFDMSRYAQRHVAFKVAYIGTDYQGFQHQADVPTGTVEGQLVQALTKTCLITDRDSCGISCGGRTDKGVSALGQVVALRVRSNLTAGDGIIPPPCPSSSGSDAAAAATGSGSSGAEAGTSHDDGGTGASGGPGGAPPCQAVCAEELDYCRLLNRVLPHEIRVLGWHPVDADFSARFSARGRTYKYFFVRAGLDVERMRAAAQLLIGEHDLRNFCKIDPNVTNFVRSIRSFTVTPVTEFAGGVQADSSESLWAFTVNGSAFLYHQVRCMVALLFLVGERKEAPEVVTTLLDLDRTPRRPNYDMAPDAPLLLYAIDYDAIPQWAPTPSAARAISEMWSDQQRQLMLRAAMLHTMRESISDAASYNAPSVADATASALARHVPLMQRPTAESVEVRTKGRAR